MSSVAKVEDNGDTMWRCENDIIKDLAFLNDFGDAEPCKVLYSNGRGTEIKQKQKRSENFIDPRTGEVIDVNDSEFNYNDNLHTGKGRGRHFGNLSSRKYQLQEQLRMARPFGSGDEAMESFCRRFQMESPNTAEVASTSDSDADSQTTRIRPEMSKPAARVIGSRNSVLQSNALISGLLSKNKGVNSTGRVVTNKENVSSRENDDDDDDDDDEKSKSDIYSDVSVTSGYTFREKDFPALGTPTNKQS